MTYQSVDQLQNRLTTDVFHYAKDSKKAAGRALGTLVEVITFYLLKAWGHASSVAIERGLAEYGNPGIVHNVEYSLHPVSFCKRLIVKGLKTPLSVGKVLKAVRRDLSFLEEYEFRSQVLLSKDGVLRNSCEIAHNQHEIYLCLIHEIDKNSISVDIVGHYRSPYAMFECKRVGVEEGTKKGPQTIEKAKQGAYVARTVSVLQKIRTSSGELYAVIPKRDGSLYTKPYEQMVAEVLASSSPDLLRDFVLTVGVVSNHGNWFTSDNPNKELLVLAQSYDWLLFLTDKGLSEFIKDVLISPGPELQPARKAFLKSYKAGKKKNQFTKVQMHIAADRALQTYFQQNIVRIESWFNIISPPQFKLPILKNQISQLAQKNWKEILDT
jgi:hypothetical protein